RATKDAIGDEQVLATIVVEIREQRRPAPVRGGHTGEIPDLAKEPAAAIQLKCVPLVLRMIAGLQPEIEEIERLGARRCLEYFLSLGKHVERDEVGLEVVVDLRRVNAHRKPAGVS